MVFQLGVDIHQDQDFVECFNRTLAERLFGHQYTQEMRLSSGQRSTEWVARLPAIIAALNGERYAADRYNAYGCNKSYVCGTKALLHFSRPPSWSQGAKAPFTVAVCYL